VDLTLLERLTPYFSLSRANFLFEIHHEISDSLRFRSRNSEMLLAFRLSANFELLP